MPLHAWRQRPFAARRTQVAVPEDRYVWGARAGTSAATIVNEHQALTLSAVWACVRVVSETLAMMPWRVYEQFDDGDRRVAKEMAQDFLLHRRSNPEMTAYTFRAALIVHAMLWGNGYAEIERTVGGRPLWLWPLDPSRVEALRDANGTLFYRHTGESGRQSDLPSRDVLHIRGISHDGVMGLNFVAYARRSLGLAMDLEQDGADFFARGSVPDMVMKIPGRVNDEVIQQTHEAWERRHNRRNGSRMAILTNGTEVMPLTVARKDSQWVEARNQQVQEIARWFRVPLHKIGDMTGSNYSNMEQMAQNFLTDTLQPWATQMEQEADYKLFGTDEYKTRYTRINMTSLLRGDSAARAAFYTAMRSLGTLNGNEIRAFEELNSIEHGEKYTMQAGFTTLDRIGQDPAVAVVPDEDEPDASPDGADDDLVETLSNSLRPLVRDALDRCRRRLTNRLRDAATPEAQDAQRKQHAVYVAEQLGPVEAAVAAGLRCDLKTLALATAQYVAVHGLDDADEDRSGTLLDWYFAAARIGGAK